MAVKIDSIEILKQEEDQEKATVDYPLNGLLDQSESEIKWVKLHQMFDR